MSPHKKTNMWGYNTTDIYHVLDCTVNSVSEWFSDQVSKAIQRTCFSEFREKYAIQFGYTNVFVHSL